MLIKRLRYLLLILLLNLAMLNIANAYSNSTLSFHGVGITVEIIFPEEAHPKDSINHNITLSSQANPTISNFTLIIYAPIGETLTEIANSSLTSVTPSYPLTNQININITEGTFGRLYCTLYIKTDQYADYFFTSFYTTQIHTITFSELLVSYEEKLIELEKSETKYNSLLQEHQHLLGDYSSLDFDHNSLVFSFNNLLNDYNSINQTSANLHGNLTDLQNDYNALSQEYTDLQTMIDDLEDAIEISQIQLETDRNLMIIFIMILVSLIGLIIYLRNKQKEPYVVIRKETVSVKPEKK